MSLRIDKRFVVKAPAPAVWAFLIDPYRVARALPGAAVTGKVDEQTYEGTEVVKVGPVTASYRGTMKFERLDPASRSAQIVATGQDVKGKGGASMRLESRVVEVGPGETEVVASAEVNVTGALAQFGRGLIQDVGEQIFEKFTQSVRAELEGAARQDGARDAAAPAAPAAPVPVDVVALGAGAAARAAGRSVRRPGFWAAVAVVVLVALWLLLRARP